MSTELLAQIVALIIAVTALYKAWGGARKDDLENLRLIIKEQGERLAELDCDNKALRAENATLHERLNLIRADLSTVQADNIRLNGEVETLRRENAELRQELDDYKTGRKAKPGTGSLPAKK